MSLAIELVGVHKCFGAKEVLRGVDLAIAPGQTTVLIGPSGCGKSTVLRLLLGLETPDEGRILVAGEDLATFGESQWLAYRHKVGMVFQSSALFDSLSIRRNVGFALREHTKLDAAEVDAIAEDKLTSVGLAGQGHLRPGDVSGGMKKRVAIARAIACEPELVLYDEPTTGL
ncbi:MAG: ATP-binding cassette domain-containing protein, partial [Cyanobacteria bacterium REEB65]|nr:ATP-binding cassette domain-containing protein [Cyanobacteria bacterium REEB65]